MVLFQLLPEASFSRKDQWPVQKVKDKLKELFKGTDYMHKKESKTCRRQLIFLVVWSQSGLAAFFQSDVKHFLGGLSDF